VNFHGHTVTERSHVTKTLDSVATLPGDFMTVEMDAKNVGTWLLHDSVNKHAEYGMATRYTVYSKKSDIPCGWECTNPNRRGRNGSQILAVTLWALLGTISLGFIL